MTASVGHPTLRLIRAKMCLYRRHLPDRSCCVDLSGLQPGGWRALTLHPDHWETQ
jgi:16S rRNA U516 pseudouridylate synthase RsuA-like enzyme